MKYEPREIKLPSGAVLKVYASDFDTSRALVKAVASELKELKIQGADDINHNLLKDLFCTMIVSDALEAAVWKCMEKCTYNKLPISGDTFQPMEARDDYYQVLFEVAKENCLPFGKSLFSKFAPVLGQSLDFLNVKSTTTAT